MEIKIREATKSDLDILARLISEDIAWKRYGIDYHVALQLISMAEDKFYVAENEQDIIGFCALRLNGIGNIGTYIRMIVGSPSCFTTPEMASLHLDSILPVSVITVEKTIVIISKLVLAIYA